MANKVKSGFPVWNPNRNLVRLLSMKPLHYQMIENLTKSQYNKLRSSSNSFIAKPEVRNYIFERDGFKCLQCDSKEYLTIDHRISVSNYFDGAIGLNDLNSENNLSTLCRTCNSSKKHI